MNRTIPISPLLLLASCSVNTVSPRSGHDVRFVGGNGKSTTEAIIISGVKTESQGIDAEYFWLRENMPGWKMVSQALLNKDKRAYDALTVSSESGDKVIIYFDITDFFGKF